MTHDGTKADRQGFKVLRNRLWGKGAILFSGFIMGMFFGFISTAFALTSDEFSTIGSAISNFINNQYQAGDDGEAGFLITAADLKARIKLNEGEDAANNPVLIDVFNDDYIPGTNLRFSSQAVIADAANATKIRDKVIAHRKAGFSTDLVVYCLSGHTESPPVMALGAISQAGFFDETGFEPKPKSVGLKWGRGGWGVTSGAGKTLPNPGYAATGKYTASFAADGNNALANWSPLETSCGGKTGAELVRCAAAWALSSTGGNVAGGIFPWTSSDTSYLPVDLRESAAYTMADSTGSAYAIQDKLSSLFYPGDSFGNLKKLDPSGTRTNVFVNRTQHTAGMAAEGAAMLGYKSSFLKWGLPRWNNGNQPNWPEQYNGTSAGYIYVPNATPVDTTAPTILVSSIGVDTTSATINWSTDKPATSQVAYSTTPGTNYTTLNETILKIMHSKVITGLTCSTTYYFTMNSYDGLANGVTSNEISFTTNPCGGTPVVENPGDMNGDGSVDLGDALKALRIVVGIDTPTADDILRGDMAPMSNGVSHPDGKISIDDVALILRKAAQLPPWSVKY